MHNVQIKHVVYESSVPGKTLTITGSVHGDEHCGTVAINRLIEALDNGDLKLESGRLILVPKCNPLAFEKKTRFIDRNLNRSFYPKDTPKHYEDFIDPILCGLLEKTDVLLDLHSFASPGDAFVFVSLKKPDETAFARDLGVNDFVCGWSEAFGGNKDKDANNESMGTTGYARLKGAQAAVTLECGHHSNEDAPDIGYQAALRAMAHFGLLKRAAEIPEKESQRLVRMRDVIYRQEGAVLSKEYHHYDSVAEGEVVASDAHGKPIYTAPCDGYIVLPKHKALSGGEWFYFGAVDQFD